MPDKFFHNKWGDLLHLDEKTGLPLGNSMNLELDRFGIYFGVKSTGISDEMWKVSKIRWSRVTPRFWLEPLDGQGCHLLGSRLLYLPVEYSQWQQFPFLCTYSPPILTPTDTLLFLPGLSNSSFFFKTSAQDLPPEKSLISPSTTGRYTESVLLPSASLVLSIYTCILTPVSFHSWSACLSPPSVPEDSKPCGLSITLF